jgi:hypothetical protein
MTDTHLIFSLHALSLGSWRQLHLQESEAVSAHDLILVFTASQRSELSLPSPSSPLRLCMSCRNSLLAGFVVVSMASRLRRPPVAS